MAHVELPEEEFQPLILSMKRVFAPFVDAIPSIIRIPDEIERLSKTIIDDVDSGQPDRLEKASEKLVDPMIQGLKNFYDKQNAEREAELAKIAAERETAIAEVQKLQDLGVPAEVTKQNTVNILNEKEILEKQKEFIKEQKEVSFLESQIADEKSKGDDADSERLLMLKEALEKQNKLVEEQGKVLGDRLPRQKVPETVGARDFIPAPLMEAYDNIAETANQSAEAIGSIFQPLIGLKKLFTQKEEYEEEEQEGKKKRDGSNALAVLLGIAKLIAFATAVALATKGIYKLIQIITDPFGFKETKKEAELNALKEGKGKTEAEFIGDKAATDSFYEKFDTTNMPYTSGMGLVLGSTRVTEDKDAVEKFERQKFLEKQMLEQRKTLTDIGLLNSGDFRGKEPQNVYVNTRGGDTNTNLRADVTKPTAGSRDETITSGGRD